MVTWMAEQAGTPRGTSHLCGTGRQYEYTRDMTREGDQRQGTGHVELSSVGDGKPLSCWNQEESDGYWISNLTRLIGAWAFSVRII